MDAVKNFAKAIVSDGNYDASATEIDVATGQGVRLPTAPFNAVWWDITDYPDPSDDPDREIIRVTDVDTDTLTIERSQEGTSANDKNVAGKTYALIAGMTARTITEMVGDVFGSGPALLIDLDSETVRLRVAAMVFLLMSAAAGSVEIQAPSVALGDVEGEGNFTQLTVDDALQLISMSGKIGTNQSAAASIAVGTLAAKMPIYDAGGTLLGYVPIYNSIT